MANGGDDRVELWRVALRLAWMAAGAIFWLLAGHFVCDRWRNMAISVRASIERFNRLADERRQRDAVELLRRTGCSRCSSPPDDRLAGLPARFLRRQSSVAVPSNGDGQPPRPGSSVRRRSVQLLTASEQPSLRPADQTILNVCRSRSIVSRLATRFENRRRTLDMQPTDDDSDAERPIGAESERSTPPSSAASTDDGRPDASAPVDRPTGSVSRVSPESTDADDDEYEMLFSEDAENAADDVSALRTNETHDDDDDAEMTLLANGREENGTVRRRRRSADAGDQRVRTFEECLRQERFSKCFSEYSISDLLGELDADRTDNATDRSETRPNGHGQQRMSLGDVPTNGSCETMLIIDGGNAPLLGFAHGSESMA